VGLTSLTLITAVAVTTAAALVGLVLLWRRLRGPLLPVRVLGILLAEMLLLVSLGLTINRAGDFYPSWASLLGEATPVQLPTTAAVRLSPQLAAQAATGRENGLVVPWHPAGEGDWHLAGSPVAYLPPESFRDTGVAVPVIVVASASPIPADRAIPALAPTGHPAALLFVRISRATSLPALAAGLAAELPTAFPVQRHGWALVGSGPAAVGLWQAGEQRFTALALLSGAGSGAAGPTGVRPAPLWLGHDLADAIRWAATQLPAPVGPPVALTPLPAASLPSRVDHGLFGRETTTRPPTRIFQTPQVTP